MNEARWKRRGEPAAIERLRSKSNYFSRHLLWGRTLELLKKHATGRYNSPDRVFTRADGVTPLITQTGGRYSIPIKHRLLEVFRSVFPNDKRSFTHLRKTGASYCAQRFPGLRVDVLYLAHKPQDMASQFYAQTSHAKLDEALCYMEKDFGLVERVVKRWKRTEESDE
jgi:integrase